MPRWRRALPRYRLPSVQGFPEISFRRSTPTIASTTLKQSNPHLKATAARKPVLHMSAQTSSAVAWIRALFADGAQSVEPMSTAAFIAHWKQRVAATSRLRVEISQPTDRSRCSVPRGFGRCSCGVLARSDQTGLTVGGRGNCSGIDGGRRKKVRKRALT